MGYIFDALNQNQDDQHKSSSSEHTPTESTPTIHEDTSTPSSLHSDTVEQTEAVQDTANHKDQSPIGITQELADHKDQETASTGEKNYIEIEVSDEWIDGVDDRLIALREPGAVMAEEYRSIRTSLLARWNHERHLVHTITSATPQEGKTITSLNLGLSFAELHNRAVVVIEADLRLPTFEKLLHLGTNKGLVGYLHGDCSLDEVIHQIGENGLHIIPAGGRANNDSVTLLSSQRMMNLIKILRNKYDHVIIDTPPVVELADAGILGSISDDVLLIARMNRTPKALIEQAKRTLTSYNAPVSGMIATDQRHVRRKHYYYRYGYKYNYHNRYYTKRAA
ncbi:CpsD/CapB family tyrosine-protein kinase [Poriferisphaera sp. WC338]|uniref:CpsD/CapB family tyrosine-protein kinase n=1 Tax=Poriferisphaera sp. WC338 TaxID=3425129 RepID=UPI003D814451